VGPHLLDHLFRQVLAAVVATVVPAADKLAAGHAGDRVAVPDPFYDGTERSEALPCGHLEGVVARGQIVEIEIGLLVGGGWG
jgi:hypothetical protein